MRKFVSSQRIVSAVVLSSILSCSAGFAMLDVANAAPQKVSQQNQAAQLPSQVSDAVRQDLAQTLKIPAQKLEIIAFSPQTWSDGCLGLAQTNELCTQALVPGWRVTLSDGRSSWVYRTDAQGRVLRQESQTTANLPQSVQDTVLQQAAQQSKLPVSALRIVQAERRQWSDGCLGLGGPEVLCAAVVVPGWLVTVQAKEQTLVYRTGDFGTQPVFDRAASSCDPASVQPQKIPNSELPPALQSNVVFQEMSHGSLTGRSYETKLLRNGRLMRSQINANGTTSLLQTHQIPRRQLRQFQRLLEQQQSDFNGFAFPPPRGAADYITITLTSRNGSTRYADIAPENLPQSLREVIRAWNQLLNTKQARLSID